MSASTRQDRPLLRGIAAALVLSLCGAALLSLPVGPTAADSALRGVVALLGLGYLLYVMSQSAARTGRITVVALWLGMAVGTWLAAPSIGAYVLIHVGTISAARSLYHHSSLLTALADLGLSALAVAFASWAASRTGSPWLALWCFFLVQALFVLLPAPRMAARLSSGTEDGETFERARRTADDALRRLAARH